MGDLEKYCLICMAKFNKLIYLPCEHVFCPECLQEHINLAAGNILFTCPICKIKIKPIDPKKPRKEWVNSLPTNNSKALNRYLESQKNRQCDTHRNETLNIKCNTCDVMICGQCCLSSHGKCKKSLNKVDAKNIKEKLSSYQQDLKVKLETLDNRLAKLKETKEVKVSQMKLITGELLDYANNQGIHYQTKNKQEASLLAEQKEKIVNIVEKAEENIKDIEKLVGEEDAANEPKSITTFNYQPKHTLMSTTDSVQVGEEEEDNFQINPAFLKRKAKLLKMSMVIKVETARVSIEITTTNDASNLVETAPAETPTKMETTNTADKVAASLFETAPAETPTKMETTNTADKVTASLFETAPAEATGNIAGTRQQIEPRPFQPKRKINLDVALLTGISDMIMIPDQCFLITEACFKKLWKFSITGQHLKDVAFNSEPYGLCLLEENCVAVSQPFETKITIFNCNDMTEKESFNFGKRYYGLASNDNKTIFSLYRNISMCVDIILKKNQPRSSYEISNVIKLPLMFYTCFDYRFRILHSGNILIITSATSINCITQNGEVAFCYEGNSNNKFSTIVDIAMTKDFIYIADKSTNKIHRIRPTGDFVDVPLGSKDGISQPKKVFAVNGDLIAILCKPAQNMQIQLFSN